MKTAKGNGELIRIGLTVFITILLYELIVVWWMGNKSYGLRIGATIYVLTAKLQMIPTILSSIFIVYFVSEYKHGFKRTGYNLLILICGVSVLVLTFLFAKHIHQLYVSTVHKFEGIPNNIRKDGSLFENPANHLSYVRNLLLVLDAVLACCLIYVWYCWSEGSIKQKKNAA